MKKVILCILSLMLILCGCNQTPPTPSGSSSAAQSPTDVVSVVSQGENKPLVLELPRSQQWTWNDLYDYLENPLQSGTLSFKEEAGESIALLDTDGKTSLSDQWNLLLADDMLVIKYDDQGEIIGKYQLLLVGEEFSAPQKPVSSSSPTPSGSHSEQTASSVSRPGQKKTTVTLYWQGECAPLTRAVEAFNKQSEQYEILPVILTEEITAQRLAQWKTQKSLPDLVVLNHRELTLASAGKELADLASLTALKGVESHFKKAVSKGKTVYGLPLGGVTSCLACNQELLYQAGAKVPATYEELLENAKLLRDNLTGVVPIGLTTDTADPSSMAEEFALFLQGEGGLLFTPDYQATAFYSQAGSRALAHYQTLAQEKLIGDYVVRKDLLSQKIGYGVVSSVDYEKTFGKKAKANYTAAPLVFPGETSAGYMELYSLAVPAGADKNAKKGALDFLNFLYQTPEYAVELCQYMGWVPALTKAANDESFQTEAWQVFIAAAKTAQTPPTLACYSTVETYLAECVSAVITGQDKDLALEKAHNKTQNRLARG